MLKNFIFHQNFVIYLLTLKPKNGLTINVHAPIVNLTAHTLVLYYSGYEKINLYMDKKHNAESVQNDLNEIHLTSKYSSNLDLSSTIEENLD